MFGIVLIATTISAVGGWAGYYVYQQRRKYVKQKRRERRRAYRGSNSMRKGSGKRAGDAVDAWKDQFKK
ncbi:MAG: hypothetical protein CMP38_03490 [Rickettsiales bacterium]|nr:hypothetical protein [Rickettsiales bacterium]